MVTHLLKVLEDELRSAARADIESFRRLLVKKTNELERLQKDLVDIRECERHMIMKRENMELEIKAAATKKTEIEIEVSNPKELQELKKEEEIQKAEIARIEAILCDNVDRCLEILGATREESTTFDRIEIEIENCRELLIKLKEKNSLKVIEAVHYLKHKNGIKQKAKAFYTAKLLRTCYKAFKSTIKQLKRTDRITLSNTNLNTNISEAKESMIRKNKMEENKDEYEALDNTYNQMISECVSNPGLQRIMQKTSMRTSENYNTVEEDKDEHPNLSYIFPSTFKERAPYIIPVVNEGFPLSNSQSPASKKKRARKSQLPLRTELEQDKSNFVPLVS